MSGLLGPVTLEGRHVRLEPLSRDHLERLIAVAQADEISTFLPLDLKAPGVLDGKVDSLLANQARGIEFPFAVITCHDGRVVGSTSYLEVTEEHRGTEIGWT